MNPVCSMCGTEKMTQDVIKFSMGKWGKVICFTCQDIIKNNPPKETPKPNPTDQVPTEDLSNLPMPKQMKIKVIEAHDAHQWETEVNKFGFENKVRYTHEHITNVSGSSEDISLLYTAVLFYE